jgi:hypothetical protein
MESGNLLFINDGAVGTTLPLDQLMDIAIDRVQLAVWSL